MKSFNNYLEFKLQELTFSDPHFKNLPERDPSVKRYADAKTMSDNMGRFLQDFKAGKYNFLKQYIDDTAIKSLEGLRDSYFSVQQQSHGNLSNKYPDLDNHDYNAYDKSRFTSDGVEKPRNA